MRCIGGRFTHGIDHVLQTQNFMQILLIAVT
uniref:Uncharacterized protein n=1 Tax=Pseudomonas aeruginosa TaxID=287 RepID=A6N5R5_PSEAI|nr:hypothetical protein [Pseudomonas aeruginosa]